MAKHRRISKKASKKRAVQKRISGEYSPAGGDSRGARMERERPWQKPPKEGDSDS